MLIFGKITYSNGDSSQEFFLRFEISVLLSVLNPFVSARLSPGKITKGGGGLKY